MAVQEILSWTLFEKIDIPNEINQYLANGEEAYSAFKTFRDTAVFTNKRIIIRDLQGISGKKSKLIPYHTV